MIKVLLFAPVPPPEGGLPTWTKKYIQCASEYGIAPVIVNIALQGKRGKAITNSSTIKDEIRRTLYIVKNFKQALKNNKIDVIHMNTCCSKKGILRDAFCMYLCKDIPIVLHCHCNVEDWIKNIPTSKLAIKWMVKKAKKVVVLNNMSQKYIDNIEMGKSVVVPNAIEENFVNPDFNVKIQLKQVIYVGHLFKEKGISELIEAAKMLKEIKFLLVGPINEKYQNIKWPQNMYAIGSVPNEEVKRLLCESDAFIFPSYSEGFSVSLLEAMACGLPIVASSVGANADMIEDKGGVVVPPGDSNAIVYAIRSIGNVEIRKQMSKWNVQKVRKAYLQKVIMNKFQSIYIEILK